MNLEYFFNRKMSLKKEKLAKKLEVEQIKTESHQKLKQILKKKMVTTFLSTLKLN